MNVSEIGQLISSIGFPIVAAIGLFWYMYKQQENHKIEIQGLQQSLNENSQILAQVKEILSIMTVEMRNKRDEL